MSLRQISFCFFVFNVQNSKQTKAIGFALISDWTNGCKDIHRVNVIFLFLCYSLCSFPSLRVFSHLPVESDYHGDDSAAYHLLYGSHEQIAGVYGHTWRPSPWVCMHIQYIHTSGYKTTSRIHNWPGDSFQKNNNKKSCDLVETVFNVILALQFNGNLHSRLDSVCLLIILLNFLSFTELLTFVSLPLSASDELEQEAKEKGKEWVNSIIGLYLGFAFWLFQHLESR